ncbi:bifunctional hydroxymethylpyrimidine kinase/phosphomethylpyrimidine kinase [Paucilactobacillus kaifaensis]|uniref:bifunctional hydroxymethylpyrimidine kinase/phosphomethylpyrimidine kinase n=1 Tax=Paucilactobacillus kaifaensis TaxID=2559921 RepID=UPI0010F85DFB|nr:bifunctional hydroxymethylpyrimidine kinase/phosphomethylpyrimidine kinase [Paucilactobacillus kaifaensis]
MQSNDPILVAEDLSAVGTISMKVAIPILSAFGIRISLLPTTLLSTQTEGFQQPIKEDLSPWIAQTFIHWQQENIHFSGGLIGYLGNTQLVGQLIDFINSSALSAVIFDPVMGDMGNLYPGLPADYPLTMATLLSKSWITIPNITEAQLLTNISVGQQPTKREKWQLLTALEHKMPAGGRAIITGVSVKNQIGCVWLEHDTVKFYGHPNLPGHFYGSGDVFAALLLGFLNQKEPFARAVQCATTGTYIALQTTNHSPLERRFGIDLSQLIVKISTYMQTKSW